LLACSVHPSKTCLALQIAPTELTLLFLKQKQAEEVRFQFQKSTKILGFSFLLGDDFNFMVATNNLITLYDVKLNKQKAKTVKQIPISGLVEPCSLYMEPLANLVALLDSKG